MSTRAMSTRVRGRRLGALALLAMALSGTAAWAEVRVRETGGGRLTVEAHGATVRQVLDALGAARPIRLRTSDALARTVTGTYSGSLSRVLSRVLDGYNHVVHPTATGIELEVFGAGPGVRSTVPVASSVTMVPNTIRPVSSNVDADEEAARAGATRPRVVNVPVPAIPPQPVALTGSVRHPGAPRISSNVDLDEETPR